LLIIGALAVVGYSLLMQLREKQEGLGGEVKGVCLPANAVIYQSQLVAIQSQLAALQSDVTKSTHFNNAVNEFSQITK
jgi:hypothetical protein